MYLKLVLFRYDSWLIFTSYSLPYSCFENY